jgi:hypothetical protein
VMISRRPPRVIASRALRIRFMNTCCSLGALPATGGRSSS